MLTDRTQHIRDDMMNRPRQISLERALLIKESYGQQDAEREAAGLEPEAQVVRRAKALRHILENHQIVIDDYDLILGNRTPTPRAGVVSPEMSPYWIVDELDRFPTRPQDQFQISEEDKKTYMEVLYPYFAGTSLRDDYEAHVSQEVVEAEKDKVFAVAQTDKGQGHIIADMGEVLDMGFEQLLAQVDSYLQKEPENPFYQASDICVRAAMDYCRRYAEEARAKAAEPDTTPERALELAQMAERCERLATEPCHDFDDALQLTWILLLVLQHESNASSISIGRADQYWLPYYRTSIAEADAAGVSPEDRDAHIREMLQCFYLKTNTIVFLRSSSSAEFFAGFPSGLTLMVGGQDAQGNDAANELSELLLDLQRDVRLPQPNLSIRIHEGTPDSLLHEAAEIIRLGDGVPQCFNDEVNIPAFVNRGVSLADAREYSVVGCVELSIPGRMYGLHDICMFNLMKCLDITMHENPHGFDTFEDLISAIERTIDHYIALMVEGCNACDSAHARTSPTPFLSTLVHDSLEKGKDITAGGARYNPSGCQGVGTANLADSLCVIKHVIFEEKLMTWEELLAMLDRNWEGPGDEVWRQRFINRYPKYGNDVDEVDELGRRMLHYYGEKLAEYENPRGGHFQPGSYTVSAHIPLGKVVGATPDGRRAGEQLADGGLSPMVGRDTHGPTASLTSVSKLDNYLDSNGSLLNVKFSPATLAGEEGLQKLMAYLRAFSRQGVQHIQFNVVDRATLLDAQKHPENYGNLIVRVAGYSAIFVELAKTVQDDIIARNEHVL